VVAKGGGDGVCACAVAMSAAEIATPATKTRNISVLLVFELGRLELNAGSASTRERT
jgi:hypothetical protein